METFISAISKYEFLAGEEIAPTTGNKHLQGFIRFKKKTRPSETIKIKNVWYERAGGNFESQIQYCSKEGHLHTNIHMARKLIDPMEGLEFKVFQNELITMFNQSPGGSNRYLYWYWSKHGKIGKTSFAKHICMTRNAICLSGKAADIKDGVARHIEKKGELDIAIFHFTRTVEEYISYEGLEAIKDGMFFSGKFESTMALYNQPHVIIFANFAPKLRGTVSKDRWIITNIDGEATALCERVVKRRFDTSTRSYVEYETDEDSADEYDDTN